MVQDDLLKSKGVAARTMNAKTRVFVWKERMTSIVNAESASRGLSVKSRVR